VTPYQDTYIDGRVVDKGERECGRRFDMIKAALPPYTRPFTLLDIGAAQGFFGTRFASEIDGCCSVMIDNGDDLLPVLSANALPFTIGLKRQLTEGDLEDLADCEHFDVVLALSFLHHLPDPGRALRAVLRMGEEVFIEVPGPDDPKACGDSHEWLEDLVRVQDGVRCLGVTASHTTAGVTRRLYHIRRQKSTLNTPYLGARANGATLPMRLHQIITTPDVKIWNVPEKQDARVWFPGINLQTYLTFGGVYPPRARVAEIVEREIERALFGQGDVGLAGVKHNDVRPWNVVISGELVTLIDFSDPRQAPEDDRQAMIDLVQMIRGGGA
jgi:SAM-dependent methyltransferase